MGINLEIQTLRDQILDLEKQRFDNLRQNGCIGAVGGSSANIGTREYVRTVNKEIDLQIAEYERQIRSLKGTGMGEDVPPDEPPPEEPPE
jgi:hypothetical protein